jgi:hypothetical protein
MRRRTSVVWRARWSVISFMDRSMSFDRAIEYRRVHVVEAEGKERAARKVRGT